MNTHKHILSIVMMMAKGTKMNRYVYAGMACITLIILSYNAIITKTELEIVEVEKVVEKVVFKDHRVEALINKYPQLQDYNYGSWAKTNDLSFKEAFKFYRNEYGIGTVFMWQGDYYHTYYKEEYNG